MKVRIGFVSNSSSSSFVISKAVLTREQIDAIKNHIGYAQEYFPQIEWADKDQYWEVDETDREMRMHTGMDNFDMHEFLLALGIEEYDIKYKDY